MLSSTVVSKISKKKYKKKVTRNIFVYVNIGKTVSTGRKVAIKKIKMGQFEDGLDLTAIREVKYLQELRHPNIIEVIYYKYRY